MNTTTDWQAATAEITARTQGNSQIISCTHAVNEEGGEIITLDFYMTHGAKDEAQLYSALDIAAEVIGRRHDSDGNGDGTRTFSWTRGDCEKGFCEPAIPAQEEERAWIAAGMKYRPLSKDDAESLFCVSSSLQECLKQIGIVLNEHYFAQDNATTPDHKFAADRIAYSLDSCLGVSICLCDLLSKSMPEGDKRRPLMAAMIDRLNAIQDDAGDFPSLIIMEQTVADQDTPQI